MDDLIYSFLLQSGFPRASIIFDTDLLGVANRGGSGMKVPAFVIVDPESAEPLAVVEVVDNIDTELLKQVAIETGAYASRLAGKMIQGFVIRVDVHGRSEEEQVQFYRIWPNSTLHQLSSKNFPDLEALRVARKLMQNRVAKAAEASTAVEMADEAAGVLPATGARKTKEPSTASSGPGAGLYVPAIILLLLIIADSVFTQAQGKALLSVSQSLLAFGAAILFTLPAAIRYLRR